MKDNLTLRETKEMFRKYKNGANSRNLVWELTLEEVASLIFSRCHYCGSSPSEHYVIRHSTKTLSKISSRCYNGIDRKNNKIGYIKTNVVTCCQFCNKSKSSKSYAHFINWCNNLAKFRKLKNGKT
jgi:hypothetical protein